MAGSENKINKSIAMDDKIKQKVTIWINEVFKKQNYDKINVQFPSLDSSGGYAAEMIYANVIAWKDGNEKNISLIVKKGKDFNGIQDTLNLSRSYDSEVRVYSKYIPYIQKFAKERNVIPFENIPYCYGTLNKDNQYVIFMENLKVRNFKVHNIEKPIDLNHVNLVLKAYAKLHALWFAVRDQEPKIFDQFKSECAPDFLGTKIFEYIVSTVHKELESVIGLYREKRKLNIIDKLVILKQKYESMVTDSFLNKDEDYLVMRHGDCWNNNYLFHYNDVDEIPDEVVIIDWQMGLFGSPLADITTFFFFCCSRKELEHLEDLLKLYYDEVSRNITELGSKPEECFPWKICQQSFKRYAPIAIAGMSQAAKLSCQVQLDTTYDLSEAANDGDFCKLFEGRLRDPEEYFDRINGVFELCIKRGLI